MVFGEGGTTRGKRAGKPRRAEDAVDAALRRRAVQMALFLVVLVIIGVTWTVVEIMHGDWGPRPS
jgi:hypothetical protein